MKIVCTFALLGVLLTVSQSTAAQPLPQTPPDNTVMSIDWGTNDNRIAIGTLNQGVHIVDVIDQTVLTIPPEQTGIIYELGLLPYTNQLVAVGEQPVNIWDTTTGEVIRQLTPATAIEYSYSYLDWSPDGRWLLTGRPGMTDYIVAWDMTTMERTFMTEGAEEGPIFSITNNGQLAASNGGGIRIWDVESGEMTQRIRYPRLRSSLMWSADGTRLLMPYTFAEVVGEEVIFTNWIQIMAADTGSIIQEFPDFPISVRLARWNPDETLILSIDWEYDVRLTDTATGMTTLIRESDAPIVSADWSPYGAQIAIGIAHDGMVRANQRGEAVMLGLKIIVPSPSLEKLNALLPICRADAAVAGLPPDTLPVALTSEGLGDAAVSLAALVTATRHPCWVDLRALVDALISVPAS
jgi:WD40 repeat protein